MAETRQAVSLSRTGPFDPWVPRFAELTDAVTGAVSIVPEQFVATVDLRVDVAGPGADAVAAVLGAPLPTEPNTWVRGAGGAAIWLGPDEWLLRHPSASPADWETVLRTAVARHAAAVVEVSGQRAGLRLGGGKARELLSGGCSLDLHPSVFRSGRAAQTTLGQAGVILTADQHDIGLLVRASFADYLAGWLLDAALEYHPDPDPDPDPDRDRDRDEYVPSVRLGNRNDTGPD